MAQEATQHENKYVAIELTLFGRVQGVGFRYFVYTTALRFGTIRGWVQNCPDGTVKVHGESSSSSILTAFIDACLQGPPLSKVVKGEKRVAFVLGCTSFEIR